MNLNQQIAPRTIRQVLFLAVILILGFILYRQLHFLLGAFLGAVALYVLCRRTNFILVYQRNWKPWLSALVHLIATLIIIVLPLTWMINKLIQEFGPALKDTSAIESGIKQITAFIEKRYKVDLLSNANMQKIPGFLTSLGGKVITATLSALLNLVVMYFLLWFMLANSSSLELWLRRRLPLKNTNKMNLLREIQHIVMSNTIGIPVLALLQGILATIGWYMFDVEKPILWGLITGMASVVPFVGCMAAWLPLAIMHFAKGDTSNGYWIAAWGLVVVGSSDNILRFVLQKYTGDIHPLITVFGVIVGLNMFGFLGLIFGPLLISLFLILIRIYNDEYGDGETDTPAEAPLITPDETPPPLKA